jgi:hypothetical protein
MSNNPLADLTSEERTAGTAAIAAAIPALAASSTVAIAALKLGTYRHVGSGTLLAVADARFIVTAAHVVIDILGDDFDVAITTGRMGGSFLTLSAQWIVSAPASNGVDSFDVAIYRLPQSEHVNIPDTSFVRLGDVSFKKDLSLGYFVVTGCPAIWSSSGNKEGEVFKTKLLQFCTVSTAQNTAALDEFNVERHFLLEAKSDYVLDRSGSDTWLRTRSGFSAEIPRDLGGISGCSVWMIGDLRKSIFDWKPHDARIVGIETAVYRQRGAIRATRWVAVSSLLYQACPDLRAALEIHRPVTSLEWRKGSVDWPLGPTGRTGGGP